MRVERDKIQGPYIVNDVLSLHGMIAGDATVSDGARLELRGMVTGSLTVLEGGMADVFGTVGGDLICGGTVSVSGTVVGQLVSQSNATVAIQPGSIINGIKQ